MLPHTLRLAARATRPALPTSTFLSAHSASRGTRRARAIHSHVSAPPTHRLRVLGIYSRSAAPSHMTASTHLRHMPRWVARQMSTAEPKPDPNAEGADPKKNVPMITQVARGAKAGGQLVLILAIGTLVIVAAYYIVKELFPTKMSTNSVFNRAADVVRANPDVHNRLGGDMKCYGQDYNTRREGRRFHIPEARFQKDGVEHLRIIFTAEGPGGAKAKVFAEVTAANKDRFEYLIVQFMNTGQVLVLEDNRKPEKPVTVRQSDVAMALQAVRAVVYGTADDKATQKQMEVLGKSFSLIKFVDCAHSKFECSLENVTEYPSWKIDGDVTAGIKNLEELEQIAETLRDKTAISVDGTGDADALLNDSEASTFDLTGGAGFSLDGDDGKSHGGAFDLSDDDDYSSSSSSLSTGGDVYK